MRLTIDEFKQKVLPALCEKHKEADALKVAVKEWLNGCEVVDKKGEVVDVETLIVPEQLKAKDQKTEDDIADKLHDVVASEVKNQLDAAAKSVKKKALHISGGDPVANHAFKSFAHFADSVAMASRPGGFRVTELENWDARVKEIRTKAPSGMSVGVPADGGFLVPPEFSTTIWDGLNKATDNLISRTDNYTVTGESLTLLANGETSRATGSRWGGVRGYWLAEADQKTSSKPTFRQIKLEPKELAVFVYVTDKLLKQSSVALEQYLTRCATEEISFLVNDAIINGTGAGQPLGIMSSGCKVEVAKEAGQLANTVVTQNIVKMWARMHANSRSNAVWFINQNVEPQLQQMTLGIGASGVVTYLPPGGLSTAPYATLLGRPVLPIEYCQTLGTAGDIILADLSAYASATRGGIESAMSIHLRFDYNETAFRFVFEVDGQPWLASALTPYKGTATLSPFVALATRA